MLLVEKARSAVPLRLFGVTMAERGVSQIVSGDLKRAEEIGAVA